MSGLGGVGYGGIAPSALQQFQNLFQIDPSGAASVVKTGAGTQATDALYSALDPNNSGGINAQQITQALPGSAPPGSGFSDQMQAQMIGYQAHGWPGASNAPSGGQPAQNLFAQIDANGDGSISTGSVSEQQFAQSLFAASPRHHHHHGGTHAASAAGGGNAADGSSAADALTSLFNADGGSQSGASRNGGTSSSPGGAWSGAPPSSADLAHAFALYRGQLEQLLSGIRTPQSASIA
jgi:hypothetical protein